MTYPVHDHRAERSFTSALRASAPAEWAAFAEFNSVAVGRTDGAIPRKYRELIALAVALTTQCQYCISSHTAALDELGATQEEIAEVAFITAALRAGAAYTHGLVALRYFSDAKRARRAAHGDDAQDVPHSNPPAAD